MKMSDSLQVTPMTETSQVISAPSSNDDACSVIPDAAEAAGSLSQGLSELLSKDEAPSSGDLTRTLRPIQDLAASSVPSSLPPLPDNTPERAIRHSSPSPSRLLGAIASSIGIGCKHRQNSRDLPRDSAAVVPDRSLLRAPKDVASEVTFGGRGKFDSLAEAQASMLSRSMQSAPGHLAVTSAALKHQEARRFAPPYEAQMPSADPMADRFQYLSQFSDYFSQPGSVHPPIQSDLSAPSAPPQSLDTRAVGPMSSDTLVGYDSHKLDPNWFQICSKFVTIWVKIGPSPK